MPSQAVPAVQLVQTPDGHPTQPLARHVRPNAPDQLPDPYRRLHHRRRPKLPKEPTAKPRRLIQLL
ncbi:hypothetical protein NL521_29280, partial [Klebsiella pneumoniae]|nr:hypothetical protein [Klebsiella pneumoniae]